MTLQVQSPTVPLHYSHGSLSWTTSQCTGSMPGWLHNEKAPSVPRIESPISVAGLSLACLNLTETGGSVRSGLRGYGLFWCLFFFRACLQHNALISRPPPLRPPPSTLLRVLSLHVSPVDADRSSHRAVMFPGRDWIKPGEDLKKKRNSNASVKSHSKQSSGSSNYLNLCVWKWKRFKKRKEKFAEVTFRYFSRFSPFYWFRPAAPLCYEPETPHSCCRLGSEHVPFFQVRFVDCFNSPLNNFGARSAECFPPPSNRHEAQFLL